MIIAVEPDELDEGTSSDIAMRFYMYSSIGCIAGGGRGKEKERKMGFQRALSKCVGSRAERNENEEKARAIEVQ